MLLAALLPDVVKISLASGTVRFFNRKYSDNLVNYLLTVQPSHIMHKQIDHELKQLESMIQMTK